MPAFFSVLALDLHNTIYDEVAEYGTSLEEAILTWAEYAQKQGKPLTLSAFHAEIAKAHRTLGSDWDGDVWKQLPTLKRLGLSDEDFTKASMEAEARRSAKSKQLIMAGLYDGIRETLTELHARGVRIYIVTEAAADIAMQTVIELNLTPWVDGVYSYPSRRPPETHAHTLHKQFLPLTDGAHLRKPHPYLLASVMLDEAIDRGEIPPGVTVAEAFDLQMDTVQANQGLPEPMPRLTLKNGPHAAVLAHIRDTMIYVGDSKFKDGMMARNAGVAFGFAAYGKKVSADKQARHRRSLDLMYAVTGWDPDTLKLTQESARSEAVDSLKPDYVFEDSLIEALPLFPTKHS